MRDICQVPTDAYVYSVTTVQNGGWWQNGVSINGETLLIIYGASMYDLGFSL
jgi:hypothetical protein